MSNIPKAERRRFVGASEIASVFSMNLHEAGEKTYETRYELWARKSGKLKGDFADNDRTLWGRHLESGIAAGMAEMYGWDVIPRDDYVMHDTVDRMGCSPDFGVTSHPCGDGLIEIKNVDGLIYRQWPRVEEADDRSFVEELGIRYHAKRREPPLRLQLQLQHQLACTGLDWGVLAMLVGGNDLVTVPYPRVQSTIDRIEAEVPIFWAEVDTGVGPPIDWAADFETVARLHGYADPLKVANLRSDQQMLGWARDYQQASADKKDAEGRRSVAKAKMLDKIGDAHKAFLPDGFSISAGEVAEKEISYVRKGYRNFRLNQKKR